MHLPRDGHYARLDTGREGMAGSGFGGHGFKRMRNGLELGMARVVAGRHPLND